MKWCRWICLGLMWSFLGGSLLHAFNVGSHELENQEKNSFSLPCLLEDVLEVTGAESDIRYEAYHKLSQSLYPIIQNDRGLNGLWKELRDDAFLDPELLVSKTGIDNFMTSQLKKKEEDGGSIPQKAFERLGFSITTISRFSEELNTHTLTKSETSFSEWQNSLNTVKKYYEDFQTELMDLCKSLLGATLLEEKITLKNEIDDLLKPKVMMISGLGGVYQYYRISQTMARHVISVDEYGVPLPKKSERQGNHRISFLPSENIGDARVFFKSDGHPPLNPSYETMTYSLYQVLDIPMPVTGMLMIDGVKFEGGYNPKPYFIQASQAIKGESAKKHLITEEEPRDDWQQSMNLTPESYSQQMIGALLSSPCDGKPENFIVHDKLGIISIDNDEVFAEPVREDKTFHLKSLLFAFPQMEVSIPSRVQQYFKSLNPGLMILVWMRELEKHYDIQQQFLNHTSFFLPQRKFKDAYIADEIAHHLQEDLRMPLTLDGIAVKNVYERLNQFKIALLDNDHLTGDQALEVLYHPMIATYYKRLREELKHPYKVMRAVYGYLKDKDYSFAGIMRKELSQTKDLISTSDSQTRRGTISISSPPKRFTVTFSNEEITADKIIASLLAPGFMPFVSQEFIKQSLEALIRDGYIVLQNAFSFLQLTRGTNLPRELIQPFRRTNPELDWMMTVEENFLPRELSKDKDSSFLIEGGWMGKRVLSSTIAKEVLNKQGQLKKDETLSGRSVVRGYPENKPLFYFKAYPEFPGYEYGATSFMRRLGIQGLPSTDLLIFRPGEGTVNTAGSSQQASSSVPSISAATRSIQTTQDPYPVLLTQAVKGDILKKHWDKPLANLDFEHTSRLIIASMLINPEDGKEDNFILSSDERYLIPIDNDHVFLPGATRTVEGIFIKEVNTTLQGKTILYCLDEMKRSLLPETVEFIKSINVDLFLRRWLEDLALANEKYQHLVKEDDEKAEKSQKATLTTQFFKKGTALRIPLDPSFINNLYWKFHELQNLLNNKPNLSLIRILSHLEPYIGKRYREVLHLPTLEARFKEATKNLYKVDERGGHISILDSHKMVEIMRTPESEMTGRAHTIKQGPAAALSQLDTLMTEVQRQEWKAYLEQGKEPKAVDGSKAGEEQAYIDSLKASKTPPEILAIHKSRRLYGFFFSGGDQLTPLLDHDRGVRLKLIDLKRSEGVDERAVQVIGEQAPNLEVLNVSHCSALKDIKGPNPGEMLNFESLRRLIMNGCTQLTTLFVKAPLLQMIEASHNSKLDNFMMETPELMTLRLYPNGLTMNGIKALIGILPQTKVKMLEGNNWQSQMISLYLPDSQHVSQKLDTGVNRIGDEGVKFIAAKLPTSQVTTLKLWHSGATLEGIKALSNALKSTSLTALDLYGNTLGDEGIEVLAAVLPQTQVTSLDVSYNNITARGMKSLAKVLPNTRIQTLNLEDNPIGDEGLEALAAVLPKSSITELSLPDYSHNNFTSQGIKVLRETLPKTKLRKLGEDYSTSIVEKILSFELPHNTSFSEFHSILLKGDEMLLLADLLPESKVQSLSLRKSEGLKHLFSVLPRTEITHLALGDNNLGDEEVEVLASVLPHTQIIELNLNQNNITKNGMRALSQVLPKTRIRSLHLKKNKMDDEGWKILADVLPDTEVSELSLDNMTIESLRSFIGVLPRTKIQKIGEDSWQGQILSLYLPNSQGLKEFKVEKSDMGDEGVKVLAERLPDTGIEKLILNGNNITHIGAGYLSKALPGARVIHLNLNDNKIGDDGVKALAETLSGTHIAELHLENNGISKRGIAFLSPILPKLPIRELILRHNKIGDEGVRLLVEVLPTLRELTLLSLWDNRMTAVGMRFLSQVLPKTALTSLGVEKNKIGDEGLNMLTAVLQLSGTKITGANLNETGITGEGIRGLSQVLSRTSITDLALERNNISDETIKLLAKGLVNSKVTVLRLQDNNITSRGLKTLLKYLPRTEMTHLYLENNDINDEGIEVLVKVVPELKLKVLLLKKNRISDVGKSWLNDIRESMKISISYYPQK